MDWEYFQHSIHAATKADIEGVDNHSMQILMTACNDITHEQFTTEEKKETFKATVPSKGCFAQRVAGTWDNLPRETEGVASA